MRVFFIIVVLVFSIVSCKNENQNTHIANPITYENKDKNYNLEVIDSAAPSINMVDEDFKHEQTLKDINLELANEFHDKALSELLSNGDLVLAKEYIDSAISYNYLNSNSYYVKGNIIERMYSFKGALEFYLKALEIDPQHKDAIGKTAICYGKLNDKENFCKYANLSCDLGDSYSCEMVSKFCN
jgi:tetratricopeptide (TPR) repeat protein